MPPAVVFLIAGITVSGMRCTQPSPPVNPWGYLHEGITINIKADSTLNRYEGKEHTLKLVVYQLTDNGSFLDLSKTSEGANRLLKADKFDPAVVGRDLLIVKPYENKRIVLGRVENAKWVGMIAGYFQPEGGVPPSVLVEIPLITKRKTLIRGMFESLGLLPQKDMRTVPSIEINVMLTAITMYKMEKSP